MRRAQIIGIAVAGVCGLASFFLMKSIVNKPREVQREIHTAAAEVLVARSDIPLGTVTTDASFRWQVWPEEAVPSGAVTRRGGDGSAAKELAGGIARAPILAGEPITRIKLVKAGEGGVLASILPQGMRAVSTKITDDTAVGKMILPNDHVDVILIRRQKGKSGDEHVSDTLFRNVRVLAIGQQLEAKEGKKGADGTTATLELDPVQAETLALSKSQGEISLALRSIADFSRDGSDPVKSAKGKDVPRSDGMRIIKYGVRSRATGLN
ncbi:MAG: Flp pilus assembly protein CpaB [Hyphomicrobiaceae bacterium]